ncbi:ribonuclease R [Caldicellulosiruptoraceae bacterium PP1]
MKKRDFDAKKEEIYVLMREESYHPMTIDELLKTLELSEDDRDDLKKILELLEDEGKVIKTKKGRYGLSEHMGLYLGTIEGNQRGFAFLIPDNPDISDIYISAEDLNGAMHGDRVLVKVIGIPAEGKKNEGYVERILKRGLTKIVGRYEDSKNFGFVVPDDQRIAYDFYIPKNYKGKAKTGQKVVVEITHYPEKRRNPEGRIVEVLGYEGAKGVDILSIIKKYELEEEFPDEVLKEIKNIHDEVTTEDIKDRVDLRHLNTITIDGEDAKDFDDAVSIEKLKNGNYLLGVHIADVSYYVKANTHLDKEAYKRGTSVYLVDRVIPMLPEKLSNGICSLNPNVDRLTFSVMMEIDKNGNVVKHDIFESVIKSKERMTYTNVTKILKRSDDEVVARYRHLIDDLELMKELALILREKRMKRGALDFDFDEAKVLLDKNGKPIDVYRYEITISNKIIEEFMLICNETVANHFYWMHVPFLYRVHEEPDYEKILNFAEFIYNFGYVLKGLSNKVHPKSLQAVLEQSKGTPEERIIHTICLRSLKKARYSEQPLGHFGLSTDYYSHFTSPIRRYPDLVIHRIMKEVLFGDWNDKKSNRWQKKLPEIAKWTSQRERLAEEAELETVDLKKVEFMQDKVDEEFEGIISNVTAFGFFVELENTIEGLVRVSSLFDDYYIFNPKSYSLIGEKTKKRYRIGDKVKVRLLSANISLRQIEFVVID